MFGTKLPSPSSILIGLIAADILRHAQEWPTMVKVDREEKDKTVYYRLKRKCYELRFVHYGWRADNKLDAMTYVVMDVQLNADEAKVLSEALTKARQLYQSIVDAEKAIKDGMEANAKEAKRQHAACNAIERFMTHAT